MLRITGLSKAYGEHVLFRGLDLAVGRGERVGLVGRNGSGKTTLLGIIAGAVEPDAGTIEYPSAYRIGRLEQHITFTQPTVRAEGCRVIAAGDTDETWRVEKLLFGLGFTAGDLDLSPDQLSGGYQLRLSLAKALVNPPDLLLLDEPNNYLDIVALRWLGRYLREWKGELMLITHDRQFMDGVVTHAAALHRGRVRKIAGDTRQVYEQIALEEEVHERTRRNDEKHTRKVEEFISRFRAKARLAGMVQSRIKSLAKQEKREALAPLESPGFSFTSAPFPAAQMMAAYNISFGYPGAPRLLEKLSFTVGRRDRICVIGRNGRGKTTLLRLLAGELAPDEGTLKCHAALARGYYSQTNAARLHPARTVFEEIAAGDPQAPGQRVRDTAGAMMFSGDLALKKIGVLSGGERSRVLLGRLLLTPAHLLLLDEPASHLDMESCDALVQALDAFEGSVVMVTHNEMHLHHVATRLIVFDRGRAALFEGTYQDYLDADGWGDEAAPSGASPSVRVCSPAERIRAHRRARAELVQERTRVMRPLEETVKALEERITGLERDLHEATEGLIAASMKGDPAGIASFSKKTAVLRPVIEKLYDDLDRATSAFEGARQDFALKIQTFDDGGILGNENSGDRGLIS